MSEPIVKRLPDGRTVSFEPMKPECETYLHERDQLRLALQEAQQRYQRYEELLKTVGEYQVRELNMLSDLRESQQKVKELEHDYELVENEVTFEVNRDRLGPTEDLPQTIRRIMQQRDSAKERAAELEHANNSWIHENEKWKEQRDQQQTAIQELAEALRRARTHFEIMGQSRYIVEIETALQAASPWLQQITPVTQQGKNESHDTRLR